MEKGFELKKDKYGFLGLVQTKNFDKPKIEETILESITVEKVDLDVNNDGKVDNKDFKIMGQALGKRGGRPRKSKK